MASPGSETTRRIRVGPLDVAYRERGTGERPFVLVHGFTGSSDDFADVLDPLSSLGRTVAPDQRGHGDTSNPRTGYSLDQLVADLAAFLDAADAARCDLLGHSLGGMVALRLTLAHPERVASLVLMDTAQRPIDSVRGIRAMAGLAAWMPPRWMWRLVRSRRDKLPGPMRRAEQAMGPERYWERLRLKLEAMDRAAYRPLAREISSQVPLTPRLGEIRCPTLVIVGDQDEPFLAPSSEMADAIPDAKLVVVPDSHHSPQIEATEAWLDAIRAHLERARA
ncbi:MAG TPA: alpha/beta hydrolase [Myxococcota bacterium]|nr:alpha/beta hydrolase [Myxococcota bacterium]